MNINSQLRVIKLLSQNCRGLATFELTSPKRLVSIGFFLSHLIGTHRYDIQPPFSWTNLCKWCLNLSLKPTPDSYVLYLSPNICTRVPNFVINCGVFHTNCYSSFQIDLDTIDVSNLNRQFLFRKEHVGKSKSQVGVHYSEGELQISTISINILRLRPTI